MPFYANVGRTPAYLEDTTTRVTSENFYWANRIIGALADGARTGCVPHVERYQEALPAGDVCPGSAPATSASVRMPWQGMTSAGSSRPQTTPSPTSACRQTEALMDHVLYEASMGMGNAFCRSDG